MFNHFSTLLIMAAESVPKEVNLSNAYILASVILILIGVVGPCLVWFVRNFLRIVMKKNYEMFNRSLKWVCLAGFIIALVGLILIILITTGAIVYE